MAVLDLSPFNAILKRLEMVADRMESAAAGGVTIGEASSSSAAAPKAGSLANADDCEIALAFDAFLQSRVPAIQEAAKASGIPDLEEATEVLVQTFRMLRDAFAGTGIVAKPNDTDWAKIFVPVVALGSSAQKACDNRSDFFQSRKIAAESVNVVALITQAGPPSHVQGILETVDFHCVKAMQKKNEPETLWVKAVKEALKGLLDWCKDNCKMGLQWKIGGDDAATYFESHPLGAGAGGVGVDTSAATGKAKGKGKGPPPPKGGFSGPPPEVKAALRASAGGESGGGGGTAELFAGLQNFDVHKLKKVTDDMKTKNRPEAEKVAVVAAAASKAAPRELAAKGQKGPKGAPLFELQKDTNWMIENHDGRKDLVLEDALMSQLVCIINCRDCVVHIKSSKVKNINVDGCLRTTVICNDVVSAVEFVNSDRIQFQTMGLVHAIAIDKCDGVNLYVPKASEAVEISTSKSSDMNVNVPDPDCEDEMVEIPIPEQFVTKINGKKLKTEVSALYSH